MPSLYSSIIETGHGKVKICFFNTHSNSGLGCIALGEYLNLVFLKCLYCSGIGFQNSPINYCH